MIASMIRSSSQIDIILPHKDSKIRFHVKRYANGHVAYDMEKNGKMAYGRFIQITQAQLDKLISNEVKMTEARAKGFGLIETLNAVYGK